MSRRFSNVLPETTPQARLSGKQRRGFTLIESLITLSVIGIVTTLIVPAVQAIRESARKTQCKSNLKQIGLALRAYHDVHTLFPYGCTVSFPATNRFTSNKHVWTEFVLPYLDQGALYKKIDFSTAVDAGANRALFEGQKFPIFACPSNPSAYSFKVHDGRFYNDWALTDKFPGAGPIQGLAYPVCAGSILPDLMPPDCITGPGTFCVSENPAPGSNPSYWTGHTSQNPGVFTRGVTRIGLKDITDGASHTFLAGERNAEECCLGGAFSWNAPVFYTGQKLNSKSRDRNPFHFWQNCGSSSHHQGGGHFLFADGNVRFITDAIDYRPYCYYGDKADGMITDTD